MCAVHLSNCCVFRRSKDLSFHLREEKRFISVFPIASFPCIHLIVLLSQFVAGDLSDSPCSAREGLIPRKAFFLYFSALFRRFRSNENYLQFVTVLKEGSAGLSEADWRRAGQVGAFLSPFFRVTMMDSAYFLCFSPIFFIFSSLLASRRLSTSDSSRLGRFVFKVGVLLPS